MDDMNAQGTVANVKGVNVKVIDLNKVIMSRDTEKKVNALFVIMQQMGISFKEGANTFGVDEFLMEVTLEAKE